MASRLLARLASHPRGFVLIVALLLGVATAAVAVGLVQTSGAANVGVVHSNAGQSARELAGAGLARAEAYALTVSRGAVDFDRVLDPQNEADCSNLDQVTDSGVVPETGFMYLPRFTDAGATTVTFEGLRWRLVPYNGGAYLIRFSDNFDDSISAPGPFPTTLDWTSSTSNNRSGAPGAAAFCAEGPTTPTAAPTPGIQGVNNPARDRDRTITVNVVGIFPGTNPATAKHRAMLSKVLMDARVVGPAGIRVGGTVDIDNGSRVQFCSEVSGIAVTNLLDSGPPGSCACGTVQATNVQLNDGSCGGCCGTNTYVEVDGASQPAPVIPVVRAADWYDYSSQCNFYVDPATMSFYYWDGQSARNGVNCSSLTGTLPTPSRDVTNIGSCWVPIWFNNAGTPTTQYAFTYPLGIEAAGANDEIDASVGCGAVGAPTCTLEWRPRNAATGTVNLGTTGVAYYNAGGAAAATVNVVKPNWATACPRDGSATSDFTWNPPQAGNGGEAVGCTTCNGTTGVFRMAETSSAPQRLVLLDNARAVPTGVYFHAGAIDTDWTQTVPTAQGPLSGQLWPMMTFIVEGNFTTRNSGDVVFGVGTQKKLFPSLVVGGNFSTNNAVQVALAGSLYVRGDLSWDHGNAGGSTLYGRVEVTGDLETASGSRMNWDYDVDLFAAGLIRRAKAPRLSVPMGF